MCQGSLSSKGVANFAYVYWRPVEIKDQEVACRRFQKLAREMLFWTSSGHFETAISQESSMVNKFYLNTYFFIP